MAETPKLCSVEGCDTPNKHIVQNYCSRHYAQVKKYGKIVHIKNALHLKMQRNTGKTQFQNGVSSWNKGVSMPDEVKAKISIAKKGRYVWNNDTLSMSEMPSNWSGDDIKYGGLHKWVRARLGRPSKCEHCGIDGLSGHSIHWANKSHEYKRDLDDWIRLCVQCHMIYDGRVKKTTKVGV